MRLQHSQHIPHAADILRLGPTLTFALHCQTLLSSLSVFLYWRTYFLATISFAGLVHASRHLLYAIWVTRVGAFHGAVSSCKMAAYIWDSKAVQMLRQKLFYEFALFILGMGNPVILLLFWPGWLVVGGTTWAVLRAYG